MAKSIREGNQLDASQDILRVTGVAAARRALLPRWIRFFSWIFLLYLAAPVGVPLLALLAPDGAKFSVFGIRHVGSAFHPVALFIQAVIFLQGIVAYGLLWGKDWGLQAGMWFGGLGLALCIVGAATAASSTIPLDPLLLVPFLVALNRRSGRWLALGRAGGQPQGVAT